jgi:hypothetical protein
LKTLPNPEVFIFVPFGVFCGQSFELFRLKHSCSSVKSVVKLHESGSGGFRTSDLKIGASRRLTAGMIGDYFFPNCTGIAFASRPAPRKRKSGRVSPSPARVPPR